MSHMRHSGYDCRRQPVATEVLVFMAPAPATHNTLQQTRASEEHSVLSYWYFSLRTVRRRAGDIISFAHSELNQRPVTLRGNPNEDVL